MSLTEAEEFLDIYKLPVVSVPTNQRMIRKDWNDQIFRTEKEKNRAIINKVIECNKKSQPVLIGTTSINKSEIYSKLLESKGIKHSVLNAKNHEKEANIIADAGKLNAVTCATNMAGRGTDVKLGGKIEDEINQKEKNKIKELGGLFVIGTERHESRRIDNQLRGRTGRQGDIGKSKFLLSLQDDLMRIFGSEKLENMLNKLGLEKGEAIIHPWINKAVEKAQGKVEAHNFEIRKQLLKYDDVMNDQRKVIFEQRKEIMSSDDINLMIKDMRLEVIQKIVSDCIPENSYYSEWNHEKLKNEVETNLNIDIPAKDWVNEDGIVEKEIIERIEKDASHFMAQKVSKIGNNVFREAEKSILLQVLDQCWKDHLLYLDQLRQSIGLRAYGQKDPLNEYKKEAFQLFEMMLSKISFMITSILAKVVIGEENTPDKSPSNKSKDNLGKISRNQQCPCGSGKKFKHCCGKL